MKKYYHPLKEYRKTKPRHYLYKFLRRIARIILPKTEFVWTGEIPDKNETPFFVTNHTRIAAPTMFLVFYPKKIRTWSYYKFLKMRDIWSHMKTTVLKRWGSGFLLYPLVFIIVPLIYWLFRSIEPIPVYRVSKKITETYDKSIQTYLDGDAQVIFPERLDENATAISPYIYKLNRGFVRVAEQLYNRTGKIMKFYPAYSCPSLKKVVIGNPISYNPDIPINAQKNHVCEYLENQISALGAALPPHKIAQSIK